MLPSLFATSTPAPLAAAFWGLHVIFFLRLVLGINKSMSSRSFICGIGINAALIFPDVLWFFSKTMNAADSINHATDDVFLGSGCGGEFGIHRFLSYVPSTLIWNILLFSVVYSIGKLRDNNDNISHHVHRGSNNSRFSFLLAVLNGTTRIIALFYFSTRNTHICLLCIAFLCFSPFSPFHRVIHKSLAALVFPQSAEAAIGEKIAKASPSPAAINQKNNKKNPNGIFDLSHAVINLDAQVNLYGNLGLWRPVRYHDLLARSVKKGGEEDHCINGGSNDGKGREYEEPLERRNNNAHNDYDDSSSAEVGVRQQERQGDMDAIEAYLEALQRRSVPSIPTTFLPRRKEGKTKEDEYDDVAGSTPSTYFIAARRFAFLVYYHANVLPRTLFGGGDVDDSKTENQKQYADNEDTNRTLRPEELLTSPDSPSASSSSSVTPPPPTTPTIKLLDVGTGCGDQVFSLVEAWRGGQQKKQQPVEKNASKGKGRERGHADGEIMRGRGPPRRIEITAVNYSQLQTSTAIERYRQRFYRSEPSSAAAQFLNGSATELFKVLSQSEASLFSSSSFSSSSFDSITAIDSMYHFDPKRKFLSDAFDLLKAASPRSNETKKHEVEGDETEGKVRNEALEAETSVAAEKKKGGRLVCTDLILRSDLSCRVCQDYILSRQRSSLSLSSAGGPPSSPSASTLISHCLLRGHMAWLLPHMSGVFGIPMSNLWTEEVYRDELARIGYSDIEFIPLESLIFMHFSEFIERLEESFPANMVSPLQWVKFKVTGYALRHWAPLLFHYSLVVATRKRNESFKP